MNNVITAGSPEALRQRNEALETNQQLLVNDRRPAADLLDSDPDIPNFIHNQGIERNEVNMENNREEANNQLKKSAAFLLGATVVVAGVIGAIKGVDNWLSNDGGSHSGGEDPVETGSSSVSSEICVDSWAVAHLDNTGNRVAAAGLESLGTASDNPEARQAAQEAFDLIKADPEVLAGYANIFNYKMGRVTEYKGSELHDGECFTEHGEQVASELEAILAMSQIEPGEAPSDGFNAGTNEDGELVQAEQRGITGDREAVLVILPNGKKVWIMERCINPVTKEVITVIPKGPTDEPEKPERPKKPTPKPSPSKTPPTIEEKKEDFLVGGGGNPNVPADNDPDSGDQWGGVDPDSPVLKPGLSPHREQIKQPQEPQEVQDDDRPSSEKEPRGDGDAKTGDTDTTYETPDKNPDIPHVDEDKGSVKLP